MRRAFAWSYLLAVILLGIAAVAVRVPAVGVRGSDDAAPAARRVAVVRATPAGLRDPVVEVRVRPRHGGIEAPEGVSHHGQLVVDVVDAEGRPVDQADVLPVDCPGFRPLEGGDYEVEVGPCALQAVRRDGAVLARGPVSTALVDESDPAYVALEVPDVRFGGIGIEVEPDESGLRVVDVSPGAPADEVGLSPGDTIVALEGQPVADMGPERFAEATTGAEGTEVELTVTGLGQDSGGAWDGEPSPSASGVGGHVRTVRVTRAYLRG
jgi:hypothetical protein